MRRLFLFSLALVGCAAAPPAAPVEIASAWPAIASSTSVAAPPPAPVWEVEEDGKGTPLTADLDAAKVPDAPCFGRGVYRGTIENDRVTLKLVTDGDRLSGLAHYDVAGNGIEVSGKRQGVSFSIDEKGAGRFEGKCDPTKGWLEGIYLLKGKKKPFALAPRPGGEAAVHVVHESATFWSPVAPYCAKLGRTTEVKTLPEGICLPTDPKALAELRQESNLGFCSFKLSTPRVFGLAAPGAERAVNAALSQDQFSYASRGVRAAVKKCPVGNEVSAGGGFTIVYNASDVLSVYYEGYVAQANAAHASYTGPEPVVVDLQSGKRLAIGDVVSDEAAFREAILACDARDRDELEWGGKDSYLEAPRWVVVPGGIAVVVGSVAPIKYGLQGRGPIASFASLAARKLLRADSPVARLWAGVTPAATDAPFCQAMMGSGEILAIWQRAPEP